MFLVHIIAVMAINRCKTTVAKVEVKVRKGKNNGTNSYGSF